jgi:aspartokinase-like uncharacterized kinase
VSDGGRRVEVVVKVGGGLLVDLDALRAVAAVLERAAGARRVLVVAGGGPFADAVRTLDRRLAPGDEAAHWMAVLAMEQYATALAALIPGARLVETAEEAGRALAHGALPVLAPYRWLREADPLPHSWEVTSDSIAAWVAGVLGAALLVLVKPAGAVPGAPDVVDPHFSHALGARTQAVALPAHRVAELGALLSGAASSA